MPFYLTRKNKKFLSFSMQIISILIVSMILIAFLQVLDSYVILDNYSYLNVVFDGLVCLCLMKYYSWKTKQEFPLYMKILSIIVYCMACATITGSYISWLIIAASWFYSDRDKEFIIEVF